MACPSSSCSPPIIQISETTLTFAIVVATRAGVLAAASPDQMEQIVRDTFCTLRRDAMAQVQNIQQSPQVCCEVDATATWNLAEDKGLTDSLQNLCSRLEMKTRGVPLATMLDALVESQGLVNKAKYAIMAQHDVLGTTCEAQTAASATETLLSDVSPSQPAVREIGLGTPVREARQYAEYTPTTCSTTISDATLSTALPPLPEWPSAQHVSQREGLWVKKRAKGRTWWQHKVMAGPASGPCSGNAQILTFIDKEGCQ